MKQNPNFIRQQQDYKAHAKFKLIIYFKDKAHLPEGMQHTTLFSCEYRDWKGDTGLYALKRLVTGRFKGTFLTALIYDNQTEVLLHKWVFNGVTDEKRV
ncbi:hypothetical protein QQ054_13120 [Oscillatoria amoena NRMC-F 0135]|jgi:hypothetical protein|nr:MAG: hypothetical protein F9K23_18205 [Bacteroidota bacterium]MDL5046962.1 hypothetical protein [Oscillatoria amoena NRMC-F 0135]